MDNLAVIDVDNTGLELARPRPGNIGFMVGESEILFEWKDGRFNVVYDADKCTEAAQAFFDCLLPRLNDHIEAKARELSS